MTITAWAVTTGETGMRTQARGLAQAIADTVVEKTVGMDAFAPPWPDIVVSCGRRAAGRALAVRRASQGQSLAVHVQDPRLRAATFDLVIAMAHDAIPAGGKVIKVATALHDVTPRRLADAGDAWRGRLAGLGRPLAGVIVGGDLRGRAFTLADARRLINALERMRSGSDAALAIVPSRRTPQPVLAALVEAFGGDHRALVWDRTGENPYLGVLALADRLIVTSDSVSMISEALATPHPVEVLDLGFPRHQGFIQGLADRGFIRRFEGDSTPPPARAAIDATGEAAAAVRRLLQGRTGVSG
ncbi:MAG TPA: mitochondrial fission ELM1 family protein [Caulobacteraceae bacterium]|nr:mitochondrial fission ELM1 family protein [Caulobacteraceae bacterium]